MTLNELGFHKCAGIEKDVYQATKPWLLKIMNSRSGKEFHAMVNKSEKSLGRMFKNNPYIEELEDKTQKGRGIYSTLFSHRDQYNNIDGEKMLRRNTTKGNAGLYAMEENRRIKKLRKQK